MIAKGFMDVVWHGLSERQFNTSTLCGYRVGRGFNPSKKVTPDPSRVNCEACMRAAHSDDLKHHELSPESAKTLCGLEITLDEVNKAEEGQEASCPDCKMIRSNELYLRANYPNVFEGLVARSLGDHVVLPGKEPSQEPDCVHLVAPIHDDALVYRVTVLIRQGFRVVSAQVIGKIPGLETWVFLVRGEPR